MFAHIPARLETSISVHLNWPYPNLRAVIKTPPPPPHPPTFCVGRICKIFIYLIVRHRRVSFSSFSLALRVLACVRAHESRVQINSPMLSLSRSLSPSCWRTKITTGEVNFSEPLPFATQNRSSYDGRGRVEFRSSRTSLIFAIFSSVSSQLSFTLSLGYQ